MSFGRMTQCVLVFVALLSTSVAQGQDDGSAFIQNSVGKWKAEIKMWMAGPDADPDVSSGSETNEMVGDNWLVSKFEGEFGGAKFTGVGIVGYNAESKKFVNTWIDSISPEMAKFEGTYDKATKSITMLGKSEGNDGKHVTQIKDDKTRIFTMYQKGPDGDDFVKVMEITYTKQ